MLRAAAYGAANGAAVGSGAAIAGVGLRLAAQTAIGAGGGAAARITENVVTNRPAGEGVALAAVAGGGGTLAGGLVGTAVTSTAMTEAASKLHYVPSAAGPLSVPGAVIGNQAVGTAAKAIGGVAQSQNQKTNDNKASVCDGGPGKC